MTHRSKFLLYPSPRTAAQRRDPGSIHPPHVGLRNGPRLKAGVTVGGVVAAVLVRCR